MSRSLYYGLYIGQKRSLPEYILRSVRENNYIFGELMGSEYLANVKHTLLAEGNCSKNF